MLVNVLKIRVDIVKMKDDVVEIRMIFVSGELPMNRINNLPRAWQHPHEKKDHHHHHYDDDHKQVLDSIHGNEEKVKIIFNKSDTVNEKWVLMIV